MTYLAEIDTSVVPPPLEEWHGALDDEPLRHPYARPGGPAADLAWARSQLAANGRDVTGTPDQVRTWNLSSLWRIPLADGAAWLKVVPPFFEHEGALVARLAGGPVPVLLARDGGRMLVDEIPGDDLYGASEPMLLRMVDLLVRLQSAWTGRTDELLALGLPDWRGPALSEAVATVVERHSAELEPAELTILERFVADLPVRFAAVAATGIPDGLVHGDFHPGNVRGDTTTLTLLDWGDSGVGHPLLDQSAFLDRIPAAAVPLVRDTWHTAWQRAVPAANPGRAARLLAPIAAARQAVIYRNFLDRIEPVERIYHRDDPALWLRRTADLANRSDG